MGAFRRCDLTCSQNGCSLRCSLPRVATAMAEDSILKLLLTASSRLPKGSQLPAMLGLHVGTVSCRPAFLAAEVGSRRQGDKIVETRDQEIPLKAKPPAHRAAQPRRQKSRPKIFPRNRQHHQCPGRRSCRRRESRLTADRPRNRSHRNRPEQRRPPDLRRRRNQRPPRRTRRLRVSAYLQYRSENSAVRNRRRNQSAAQRHRSQRGLPPTRPTRNGEERNPASTTS